MRWSTGFSASLVSVALTLLTGCTTPLFYGDKTASLPHVPARALAVDTRNGGVTVTKSSPAPGESPEVQIRAHIGATSQDRLAATALSALRLPDGALRISVDWPGGAAQDSESATFTIAIPDTGSVTIASSNGPISITGLSGPAELKTSNGSITVESHDGPLTVSTSNGAITVKEARQAVNAKTSNGRIDVSLADANPAAVDLHTSNGSIGLEVGPAWAGIVAPATSHGRISILGSSAEADTTVGQGGAKSTLKTSNGSITVTQRK